MMELFVAGRLVAELLQSLSVGPIEAVPQGVVEGKMWWSQDGKILPSINLI